MEEASIWKTFIYQTPEILAAPKTQGKKKKGRNPKPP